MEDRESGRWGVFMNHGLSEGWRGIEIEEGGRRHEREGGVEGGEREDR